MRPDLTIPDPVPIPNLPVIPNELSDSRCCAGGLDDRIGSRSGADIRLSICCRPGRYVLSDIALYRSGNVISSKVE